jgi:hypothetical protein
MAGFSPDSSIFSGSTIPPVLCTHSFIGLRRHIILVPSEMQATDMLFVALCLCSVIERPFQDLCSKTMLFYCFFPVLEILYLLI